MPLAAYAGGVPLSRGLGAAVIAAVKQRRSSHNMTKDGGPLINYNDPEYADLPHKGKIGEQEAAFVRDNLGPVNERRAAAGHSSIDPANSTDARRYGFPVRE